MDTKQKILEVSLDLFSKRGFSAVSVRDISKQVGVKESALYKHFKNKQDVFDTLVTEYLDKSNQYMLAANVLNSTEPSHISQEAELFAQINDSQFLDMAMHLFTDFLMSPDVMKFWRMITIEQYNNKQMAQIFNEQLFEAPISFQTLLFRLLIEKKVMKDLDPQLLALEFYTPALMMFLRLLPFEDDEQIKQQSLDFFKRHMLHFREIYAIK